jgi:NAD-dependent deacetylase
MISLNDTTTLTLNPQLLERLGTARHVLVLTGAGMSAESGVPTFRDAQTGLWEKFRAEDLATPEAFAANPARVWQWYEERRTKVRAARPHGGHQALVMLQSLVPKLSVVTQNVDGLHQMAGSHSVTELHGNILRSKCSITGRSISADWLADSSLDVPPSPYHGSGYARPDVVWFGEMLPSDKLERAMAAASACDFCISAGTTSLVQPAARLPLLALENGAALVEINPEETPLSMHANQCLREKVSLVLPAIVGQLQAWKRDADQAP